MKIKSTSLQNGENLNFGDFNVFIGGNSVGKTTFLTELFSKSTNTPRNKYYWINEPIYVSDNVGGDLQLLKSSLARKYEGTNLFYISQAIKNSDGEVDLSEYLRFSYSETQEIETSTDQSIFNNIKYRRPFITFSSCEARLGLKNEVEIIGLDQPPQDPINVLYRNKKLLKVIGKTIFEIFSHKFVLLDHTRRKLFLGLSKEEPPQFNADTENPQDEFERIERWREREFIPLTEIGHGIRSMIRLLTSMLEPVNQVIMIDEPEMHLYPFQKRWLGKQLVNLAKNQRKQVFLVTHDPMVLQGILDVNTKTTIFRVERDAGSQGTIRHCELKELSDANAVKNQEQYLQGLFYQRCIVVEGATDRYFYQNMIDEYKEVEDKDLGYVACGGKGGTKHMAEIVAKVGLRAAFIYDFDILFETNLIQGIYSILGGSENWKSKLDPIFSQYATEVENIRKEKDDSKRNNLIKDLLDKDNNREIFAQVIEILTISQIFIVPEGSLESWAPNVESKVRFAEQAPEVIRNDSDLNPKFKNFAQKVLASLDIQIN